MTPALPGFPKELLTMFVRMGWDRTTGRWDQGPFEVLLELDDSDRVYRHRVSGLKTVLLADDQKN